MKNYEFAGYLLTEEEQNYLLQALTEKRKLDEHERKVNIWREHLIYKIEQCAKEIGTDDTRKILHELRTTVSKLQKE